MSGSIVQRGFRGRFCWQGGTGSTEYLIAPEHSFRNLIPSEICQCPFSSRPAHRLPQGIILQKLEKGLRQLLRIVFLYDESRFAVFHGFDDTA